MTKIFDVVNLDAKLPWDLASVTTLKFVPSWPIQSTSTLGDLGSFLVPIPSQGLPIIRPSDILPDSNEVAYRLKPRRDYVYRFGKEVDDLRIGDLLISANHPVILVNQECKPFEFSSQFVAFRPTDPIDSLWLWAVLNTQIGIEVRQAALQQELGQGKGPRLTEMPIPDRPFNWQNKVESLTMIHRQHGFRPVEMDLGQSWWRITQLAESTNWSAELVTANPQDLLEGVALSELIEWCKSGRPIRQSNEVQHGDDLPICSYGRLTKRAPQKFASADSGLLAEPGTIVLSRIGLRGLAAEVFERCLVDPSLLLIKVASPEMVSQLLDFFNSAVGQRQRIVACSGTVIPTLTPRSVQSMRYSPRRESRHLGLGALLDSAVWDGN